MNLYKVTVENDLFSGVKQVQYVAAESLIEVVEMYPKAIKTKLITNNLHGKIEQGRPEEEDSKD
jgi:hypothetical protein